MDSVNKTLYIPLRGKAYVSSRGFLLSDPDAEAIWAAEGFPLKGKAASKWLSYSMGIRAAVFDRWLRQQLEEMPEASVLHLGCGLDSRCRRVSCENSWYDVDFPQVIEERSRYFSESVNYHMISCDLREDFLSSIPGGGQAIVVMEGISMYLTAGERKALLERLSAHFCEVRLLLDSYTVFAAKATRYKNPINDVGVTEVHGFDDPRELEAGNMAFFAEHDMNPEELVQQLPKQDRGIFRLVYGGKLARKICQLYEYRQKAP
jgi:O-methyltransferase involved in polyketide biosynthesis